MKVAHVLPNEELILNIASKLTRNLTYEPEMYALSAAPGSSGLSGSILIHGRFYGQYGTLVLSDFRQRMSIIQV